MGAGRVPDGCRSRYWYYMLLHTTIGKRRSGAFKQKKVYQNRTIIKEVMSKNVCEREQDTSASRIISGWCWIMLGAGWCWIQHYRAIAKRRSRAFKQKQVYQNRTIIKEVMSKNVHPAPVPDDPTPVLDHPALIRHCVRHHTASSTSAGWTFLLITSLIMVRFW